MVQAFAVRKPWARAVLKPCARATAMLLILFSSSIGLALMPLCKALVALPLCKAIQALPLRKAIQVGPASRTSTCHPTLDPSNLFLKIQFWHLVPSTAPVHQKYWPHSGLGTCRPSKGSISISAIVQGSCPCARLQHSPCPRLPNSKGLNHEQVSAFRLLCAEVKLACCHAVTLELAFEDAFRLSCWKQLAFEDYRSLLKWMCISIRSLLKWMCISIRSLLK